MAGRTLPLSSEDFIARVQGADAATRDDVSVTLDGRRLDNKQAVLAWLREIEVERAAGRFVELDDV